MNIQLINTPNPKWETTKQIFYNRGIAEKDIRHYLNLTDRDINNPDSLGEKEMRAAAKAILLAVKNYQKVFFVIDCDCDGYCASALLINYMYDIFPHSWVENCVDWGIHQGKTHGLSDQIENIKKDNYSVVICPDSSSNDYNFHKELKDLGITVIVLDHHLADKISENAIIINNQLSNYPNKDLAGVGVTWQFCRWIDRLIEKDYANRYLDLVALGNCSDMMSLRSFETRYLISKGFKKDNIRNPFISYMIDKNDFSLSKTDYVSENPDQACTSIGAAFFIVPFINAVTRCGTLEEKNLIFQSMLTYKAYTKVPEIKWNKETGKMEYLVLRAVRLVTNIKNRQKKMEDEGLSILEKKIVKEDMLSSHKMLLFLLDLDEIQPEIRGLIANKIMSKYQRPCAILTYTEKENVKENGQIEIEKKYEGSMRGYTKTGIDNFKKLLEQCPGVSYVEGHENAAGLGIYADQIDDFLKTIDELMSNVSTEPVYRVDYSFKENDLDINNKIVEIASMNDYWGQDFERSYIAIDFKITDSNVSILKGNTINVLLRNKLSLIKFKGSEDDILNFTTSGTKTIRAYCKCNVNKWNGNSNPQLIIEDYEIISSCNYIF